MCVRFAPIFWDFNVWKCYIPKWLIIYCSPIIHKLREPTQNGVIQFMVTKRGQISIWIWVSKPQPTIGIWLCMSFRWKSQLHTLHRDLSFDAILRAFFVVRVIEFDYFNYTRSSQIPPDVNNLYTSWWPKNQWKRFLVHTSSLGSFTLELYVNQIFWNKNLTGMLWSLAKLGQKRVFSHIFGNFKLISFKLCSK